MTVDAAERSMGSSQQKPGSAMIELGPGPSRSGMAERTVLGKTSRLVIWIACVVVAGQMAGGASRAGAGKPPVRMAKSAADLNVGPGQQEASSAVIVGSSLPADSRMTQRAVLRKSGCSMLRIGRIFEIAEVA